MKTINFDVRRAAGLALVATLLWGSPVSAQLNHGTETLRKALQNNQAQNIAHNRYTLYHDLSTKWNLSLFSADFYNISVFFPALKSNRVYILLRNVSWPKDNSTVKSLVLCFQHRSGRVRLVYKVVFRETDRSSSPRRRLKSLLDYLRRHQFLLIGRVGGYAERDLATVRDYVEYDYLPIINALQVAMMSSFGTDGFPGGAHLAYYSLDKDPIQQTVLKSGQFYRTYGLPVADRELALLNKFRK